MPLLSVINGYTAHDILATRLGDLFPLSTRLPLLAGPLISWTEPGTGWARFRGGAQAWVEAMGDLARERGATLHTAAPAREVRPLPGGGAEVAWTQGGRERAERFDAVVFTTDMNNTTFDAEEGALLSAIGVAEKLLDGFESPFGGLRSWLRPHQQVLYRHFVRGTMFPPQYARPALHRGPVGRHRPHPRGRRPRPRPARLHGGRRPALRGDALLRLGPDGDLPALLRADGPAGGLGPRPEAFGGVPPRSWPIVLAANGPYLLFPALLAWRLRREPLFPG